MNVLVGIGDVPFILKSGKRLADTRIVAYSQCLSPFRGGFVEVLGIVVGVSKQKVRVQGPWVPSGSWLQDLNGFSLTILADEERT